MILTTKKIIFFALLLIISQLSFAQKVIDIKADYFKLDGDEITFFQKLDNSNYKEVSISYAIEKKQNTPAKISLDEEHINKNELPKGIINISKIKKQSINSLSKTLNNNIFFYKPEEEELNLLLPYQKSLFSLNMFYMDDNKKNNWKLEKHRVLNSFILRINKKYQVVILIDNDNEDINILGYIAPFENKLKIALDGEYIYNLEEKGLSNKIEKKLLKQVPLNFATNNSLYPTYHLQDNKIKDVVFHREILNKNWDTLYFTNGLFVAEKKNKYSVLNSQLQDITPKKLRAFYSGDVLWYKEYSVLLGNEVKFLLPNGSIVDNMSHEVLTVCGTVTEYSRKLIRNEFFYVIEKNTDYNFSDSSRGLISVKHKLFNKSDYDSICFLNGEQEFFFDENDYILNTDPIWLNHLIVKKNEKYGLLKIRLDKDVLIGIDTLYKVDLDNIETYGLSHPILLKKDNLFKYHNINSNFEYTTISKFKKGFARFTKNGRKGWLSLSGKEYYDE
ncbi:hypothetical protein [Tenacibaculum sp.]|uniref:hypothetical protein n=1 Tax=Tenacibaculum sp. TaxID=1906242 RepID=UPI003AA9BE1A